MTGNDSESSTRVHEALTVTSAPGSPRSIASLPSPPSSPPIQDHSSIPDSPSSLASDLPISSVSSSLFLSGTSSPGPQPPILGELSTRALVIPSLTVPQYDPGRGDAVGNIKLWVVGAGLPECQAAAERIIRDAPLVSEVGDWIFGGDGIATLRASTLSSAQQSIPRSMHDTKWNVEAYVADVSIDSRTQPASMLDSILAAVQGPFISTDRLLNDSEPSTTSFLPLLTSSTTHLHTAVVYLRSSPSTRHDQFIINELSPYIPVISMPHSAIFASDPYPQPRQTSFSLADSAATSTFRPQSLHQLRDNLFLNPSTLHHIRTEAGERFLRWRDLNAALRQPDSPTVHPLDVSNSRELPSGSSSRPQNRGRAGSVSSVRSSSIIFSSSQTTPRPIHARTSFSGSVRSPLAGVEEERQADWMWNWESRFSRDVQEQQQRQPLASTSTSRPVLSTFSTARLPLAATTSGSTVLELTNPTSTIRDRGKLRPPPILHDPSPPRADSDSHSDAPDEPDDPLHLRSVARLAASLVPALLRRYGIIGRQDVRAQEGRARHENRGTGKRMEKMSWGMFGLGVSVGVVLSICIVGIGMELSQHVWMRS